MARPRAARRARRVFPVAVVLCCAAVACWPSSAGATGRGAATVGPVELVPTPIGVGTPYHPGAGSVSGSAIHGMRCARIALRRFGVHLELFVDGQVVLVPGGIGVASPRTWAAGAVTGARCSYPIRTIDPTGLIQVEADSRATLGDLFAIWGRQLGPRRLIGFHGVVQAYVGGLPVRSDPRLIPLTRHAEIVLEVGGYVPPHRAYLFPRSL
jgi:hypothetical protein